MATTAATTTAAATTANTSFQIVTSTTNIATTTSVALDPTSSPNPAGCGVWHWQGCHAPIVVVALQGATPVTIEAKAGHATMVCSTTGTPCSTPGVAAVVLQKGCPPARWGWLRAPTTSRSVPEAGPRSPSILLPMLSPGAVIHVVHITVANAVGVSSGCKGLTGRPTASV